MNEKIMIKCPNCDAEYDAGLIRCPSCDFENEKKAHADYENKIDEISKERADIAKIPDKIVKKSSRKVGVSGIIIAAVIIAAIALVFVITYSAKKANINKETENLNLLESYLEARDYESLNVEMEKISSSELGSSSSYAKYSEVNSAYKSYIKLMEEIDSDFPGDTGYYLYVYYTLYCNAQNGINDSRPFGNEEYLSDILNMGLDYLSENCDISKELINQIMQDAKKADERADFEYFSQKYNEYRGEQ